MKAWGLAKTPFSEPLQKIGIGELITRSAKHIFKTYLQVLPFPPWRWPGGWGGIGEEPWLEPEGPCDVSPNLPHREWSSRASRLPSATF